MYIVGIAILKTNTSKKYFQVIQKLIHMKNKSTQVCCFIFILLVLITNYGCLKDRKLTDEKFYTKIAYTLQLCLDDIFNQNIAGHSSGSWNSTVTGPMGGTIIITGTDSYAPSVDVTTCDLFFNLQNVPYTHSASTTSEEWTSNLTFNGSISYKGTYSSSTINLSHLASSFNITGSLKYFKKSRNINETGNVILNRASQTNGTIYGNSFSW
jgi:hypothetical protein